MRKTSLQLVRKIAFGEQSFSVSIGAALVTNHEIKIVSVINSNI